MHLNIAFENHIAFLVGEEYDSIRPSSKRKMLDEFEKGIKPNFTLEDSGPFNVDLIGASNNEDGTIRDSTITIHKPVNPSSSQARIRS